LYFYAIHHSKPYGGDVYFKNNSSIVKQKIVISRSKIYFLFLFATFCLRAQNPSFNFQKLGSEDGLNNANIFNIQQHPDGRMYFTTQNGIYYYDGYSFKTLAVDSLKSNALLNMFINNADELSLSMRSQGIVNYNIRTRKLSYPTQLKFDNNSDQLILTKDFAFLLNSQIKLTIINLKTGQIDNDQLSAKEKSNRAFCIFKTSNNRVLIGRSDGLYDATEGIQVKLNTLNNTPIQAITQNANGSLVLGAAGKIFVINASNKIEKEITPIYKTKSFTFQLGGEKNIDKIITDNFDRIWFTSYPDENLYLYQNNKVYDVFDILGIAPTLINCIYKDTSQNIWIGTFNEGVYYIQNPFFNALTLSFNGNNLNINRLYLKNTLLAAATNNGLYGLNLANNQLKIISKPDDIPDPINNVIEQNDILYYSKNNAFNLLPSMLFDSKTAYNFKPVVAKLFYPISNIQSVLADNQADILLCNADGTKVLDTLISFPDYRVSVNGFLKIKDVLYIATSNGLYTYDFKTKKHQAIVYPELNFYIHDLCLLDNKLYAAHEAGITEVLGKRLITQVGNYRLNSVKKITSINHQLWLATLDGVFICNEKFELLKILNKSNGLPSNAINDIAFSNQMVCIATAKGIVTTQLKNIESYSAQLKPVTINYLTANGEKMEPKDTIYALSANQEDVSIYFNSPFFSKPNKQFFKYKLDDGEWKSINELSLILQLKGGEHSVKISASADNIVWSKPTVLSINKKEKLSEKQSVYWLITLGALLVVSGISFIWIKRVKAKARKRLEQEQQINLLKHQAMNSLLSPHFIFNSLTSIQNYINTNNSLKASEYLAKFSRLIRMIIEKAAQSNISLHDELARLTYYLELEKERFKNKFDYVINIDEDINTHEVMIPNMIIQPHVENCIIHGILPKHEHGTLTITFKKYPQNKFLITLNDDGIGLIKAQEHVKTGHKSIGTSTIKNILEINSKLTGKNQKVSMIDKSMLTPASSGTLITIELDL
jgi:ligand-binding sensor domain-containing protein